MYCWLPTSAGHNSAPRPRRELYQSSLESSLRALQKVLTVIQPFSRFPGSWKVNYRIFVCLLCLCQSYLYTKVLEHFAEFLGMQVGNVSIQDDTHTISKYNPWNYPSPMFRPLQQCVPPFSKPSKDMVKRNDQKWGANSQMCSKMLNTITWLSDHLFKVLKKLGTSSWCIHCCN